MRPIGFHSHIRRFLRGGQRMGSFLFCGALLIAGAVATVLFSPFIIGGWLLERVQEPKSRTQRTPQECQITNIQEWVEE